MISPFCCGVTLRQGAKLMGFVDMLGSILGIVTSTGLLLHVMVDSKKSVNLKKKQDYNQMNIRPSRDSPHQSLIAGRPCPECLIVYEEEYKYPNETCINLFIALIGFLLNIVLSMILLISAEQKNIRLCQLWFKIRVFISLIRIVQFIISLIKSGIMEQILLGSDMVYSWYPLWVVLAFTYETCDECQLRQEYDWGNGSRIESVGSPIRGLTLLQIEIDPQDSERSGSGSVCWSSRLSDSSVVPWAQDSLPPEYSQLPSRAPSVQSSETLPPNYNDLF